MPFNSDNAKSAGSKGGSNRWRSKDPSTVRNRMFSIKLSDSEMELLTEKASELGMSKAELIIRAVKAYRKKQ